MAKNIFIITTVCLALISVQCKKEVTSENRLTELQKIAKNKGNRAKAKELNKKALAVHNKKNYAMSEQLWYQAAKTDPSWATLYFNLACSTTLQEKTLVAIEYLKMALDLDKNMLNPALKDGDLKRLRTTEEFKAFIARYKTVSNKKFVGSWFEIFKGSPVSFHRVTLNSDGSMTYHKWRDFDANGTWKSKNNIITISGTAFHDSDKDGSRIEAPFSGTMTYDAESKTVKLTSYYDSKISSNGTKMIKAKAEDLKN